jgi:uncharacterized membrane-anchored protein
VTQVNSSRSERSPRPAPVMLSKVPEVTIWFWIIKILCTTVGESFADWINVGLGVGLNLTAVIFTVALAVIMAVQLRLRRYVPAIYWLTVVVLSVAGTLYTDILTDSLHVPLSVSTAVFGALLAVVFAVWYAREKTLSIHSIVTTPREVFYWLAVLVTFALGTAVGDWTLTLTGWGPGISVLLPASLIVAIVVGWRMGANPVLSFWLAYILTRPLGANLGDWFASSTAEKELGFGYGITSVIFLGCIIAAVCYLTFSHVDVITQPHLYNPSQKAHPVRERVMVGYYSVVAVATAGLLIWAAGQPHSIPANASEEEGDSASVGAALVPGQASTAFPAPDVAQFRIIAQQTLEKVQAGDQSGAKARVKDLETSWDDRQSALEAMDSQTWTALDGQIDEVLHAVRAKKPDVVDETAKLTALLTSLR